MLKFFRSDKLSRGRFMNIYKLDAPATEYCEAVFTLVDYRVTRVRATLPTEDMMLTDDMPITRLEDIPEGRKISTCFFRGTYKDSSVDVCVDFDAHSVNISGDNAEIIDELKRELEDVTSK